MVDLHVVIFAFGLLSSLVVVAVAVVVAVVVVDLLTILVLM